MDTVAVMLQEHKEVIAEAMEVAEYSSGQAVYCQGDTGSRFYVIKEGSVTSSKTTDPARNPAVSVLNAGQFFGERALIKDEIRRASLPVLHSLCPWSWLACTTARLSSDPVVFACVSHCAMAVCSELCEFVMMCLLHIIMLHHAHTGGFESA